MKKTLLLLLSMLFCVTINAKVSLDFTNAASGWGFPSTSSAGAANVGTETAYTNGTYTVYLYGASGNGCYANSGYIMICNSGSYIKLQGFDFAVGTIVVGGHSGGSATASMNIYVGETAVSTECIDCTADHTFEIADDYQAANTEYICMNTSSKNYQLSTIDIYAVGEEIGDDTPTGHGYEADDPYTCEEAIAIISALASGGTITNIYVKGIVSTIGKYDSSWGELIYYISDDGTTTNQLEIYDGYYLNNEKFTSNYAEELQLGDEVIVYGTFTNYYGNTPEGSMGATYIYSLTRDGEAVEPGTSDHNGEVDASGTTVTLTNPGVSVGTETTYIDFTTMGLTNGESLDGKEFSFDDGSTVVFAKGDGATNPAYYTSGNAIRVYADNTLTFTCSKCIAKIEMHTSDSSYDGNTTTETADFSDDGTTAVYCNLFTSASGGTQLRVQNITIYYAGEGGEEPEPEPDPEPDDGHTFNFEENTYGLTPTSNSSTYYKDDVTLEGNDDVTMAITVLSGNGYRLWESTSYNDLRLYNGCAFTITAPNPMTEISFYCESTYVSNMSCDVGEYTVVSTTGTWTGEATEVTFTMSGQMRIRTIDVTQEEPAPSSFTITSAGYATYYTDEEYTMPAGVNGTTVVEIEVATEGEAGYLLSMPWEYEPGTTVPANTALVLQGEEGTYTYTVTTTGAETPEDNLLQGSTTEVLTTGPNPDVGDYYFYELSDGAYGIGFYWANEDGSAFTSEAHKAWLAMAAAHPARFIAFGEGSTTGINAVESNHAADAIYTIQGVRVSSMDSKGIYIVGGKKVLVK